MGFIKRLANIFISEKENNIEWKTEFNDYGINLLPNKSIDSLEEIQDILLMYEIEVKKEKGIFLEYEDIYDLYYDEYDNKIDIYKYFKLPDIFKGILEVENKNNFLVDKEVCFIFKFKGIDGNYQIEKGNILSLNLSSEYKVIPKKLFELIKQLQGYNKDKEKRSDEASQYEMLKIIKDYTQKVDIKLNDRLRKEETPIVIEKFKIDFDDDGETIEIYPKLSDDENINKSLLEEINSYGNIRGSYSTNIDGKKIRYVIKHKNTLETIIKNKKSRGTKRLDILSGRSELFQNENIDISDFGPRVTGIGYLTYKSSVSNINTNDLDWLDKVVELPYIQGTNVNGDYENITLKPSDRDVLKKKLVELNLNDEESAEVEFTSDNGKKVKIIMEKEEIKKEIQNIDSRIKTPLDIKRVCDLEKLIDICDNYKNEKYIPFKSIYISKEEKDIKEELLEQLEKIKSYENRMKKSNNKRTLLIAENIDNQEYEETDEILKNEFKVEIPSTLKENIKLFDYQQKCLEKLQKAYISSNVNGFLLCDDMGLGKTLQLLSFLAWLKERNELTPSLIVAPSSLLNNWDCEPDGEIQKFFVDNYFSTEKVIGTVNKEKLEELKKKDIVFIMYESLRINNVILGKINWKVMICDEAQKIKNPKTLVTVAAKAQNANFKIICSATPIENTLEDLWTLTDFSKPGLLGSLKDFRNIYMKQKNKSMESDLEETNDKLYDKIQNFYLRREKSVLPKTLPQKIVKMYYVEPTSEEINILEQIKDTESYNISAIQKMLAICSHVDILNENIPTKGNINNLISKASKLRILKDILNDIKEKNEKVIIFTRLRKVQKIIYLAINEWFGVESYIVNGEERNLNNRTDKINKFKNSKGFDVIILSPEVAGFGITVTQANHVIHYSRLWNPAKEDQASDRVYRIGQEKKVTIHYPMISFRETGIKQYENIESYVKDNSVKKNELLSPEEKLNILLARKKDMLLRFFLAAGNGDITTSDFMNLDFSETNERKINNIVVNNEFNNIVTPHEFEALVTVLYEKMGYETYLTSKSNDKGVDVIAVKSDEIFFIQCKHTQNNVGLDANKDLLFAKDIYKNHIDMNKVKGCIVTSSNDISSSVRDNNDINIVDREILAQFLSRYKVFKDEIDVKDGKRYAFEELIRILR